MENHLNAFIGIAIGILVSLFFILLLWSNHKIWSIVLIILALILGMLIGDYFDRQKVKKMQHIFDM